MKRAVALALALPFAALVACFAQPDYQGGGRLNALPGASDDAGADGDGADVASASTDGFVAPPDNFVTPPADGAGTGD